MTSGSYDLLVIGGGVGGLITSTGAAKLGLNVALVEKKALGGDCLHFGCVPTKTLIRSAKISHLLKRVVEFGMKPVEAQVDFSRVMERVRQVQAQIGAHETPGAMAKQEVETILGEGKFLDPHTFEVAGRALKAKRIILATGSRPVILPIPGLKEAGSLTNESALQLDRLPASIIILGGGPIGLEFGQAFARLGSKVTILEKEGQILPREDSEVAKILDGILRKEGVEIFTCTEVKEIRRRNEFTVSITASCRIEGTRTFETEQFLVAIGRAPNVEGLNLEAAGVAYTKRGITVDAAHRTSARHIWAVGDVTGQYQFTHAAEYEAVAVLRNVLFPLFPQKIDYTRIPWTTFTDPELGRIGLTEAEARDAFGERIRVFRYPFPELDRAIIDGQPQGLIKVITDSQGQILGAHLLGPSGGELIHEFILAKTHRLPLAKISETIHVYPSLAQGIKRSADQWYLEQLKNPWVARLARLVFKVFP